MNDGPVSQPPGLQPHMGVVLRRLREAYGSSEREQGCRGHLAEGGLSEAPRPSSESSPSPLAVDAMVARLAAAGYDIDPLTYRRLEAGEVLPEAPEAFLDATITALALTQSDGARLVRQLAFDIVRRKLGVDAAHVFFSIPSDR